MVPLTAGDTVELQGYFRAADGYFAADDPANPKRVVAYGPAHVERRGVAPSAATGDARVAACAVASACALGAPEVRRVGGASTVGREAARAPVVLVDPQLRELEHLARQWTGRPGARQRVGTIAEDDAYR